MTEPNQTTGPNPNPLELVEYGDFTCPRSRKLQRVLSATLPAFKQEIYHTFRHFPKPFHSQALLMALAAEAARRQNRYWAMHQALFAHPGPFSVSSVSVLALVLGLDPEAFLADIHDETLKRPVAENIEQGRLAGVVTTPTLFFGNYRLHGKLTQARLVPLIQYYVHRSAAPLLSTVDAENGLIHWSGVGNQ